MASGAKPTGIGGGGLSPEDINLVLQAAGQNTQMMHNRYAQLGLGVPSTSQFGGDPATAAAAGGSLQYGGAGTAEKTDVAGLQGQAAAALGQLQTQNASNPAIAGTAANQIQNNQSLASLLSGAGFSSGAGSIGGVNQTG